MKVSVFLANKYIKSHLKQSVSLLICVSIFISAMITILMFNESLKLTYDKNNIEEYGSDVGILYNANVDEVAKNTDLISNCGSGVVYSTMEVENPLNERNLYLGYIDENARNLKSIDLLEGKFPEKQNEIAVELSSSYLLGDDVGLGTTVKLTDKKSQAVSEYIVVGILEDYLSKWQKYDSTKIFVTQEPPTILTSEVSGNVLYNHIICKDYSLETVIPNETFAFNFYNPESPYFQSWRNFSDTFSYPIFAIFLIIMILGISSVISNTLKERMTYISSLRKIGMLKKQGINIFLIQAIELYLFSIIIGSIFSIFMTNALITFVNLFGNPTIVSYNLMNFIPVWIFSFLAIIPNFVLYTNSMFKSKKSKKKHKTKKYNESSSLSSLLKKSTANTYKHQNLLSGIIIASCLFVSVFGSFYALYAPRSDMATTSANIDTDIDYALCISRGTSKPEDFYLLMPRGMGISQSSLNEIKSTKGIEVQQAVANNTSSHFILFEANDDNQYLEFLKSDAINRVLKEETTPRLKLAIDSQSVLAEPFKKVMDYETAISSIKISNGEIDKDKFISGKEIISPDFFDVGQKLTLITPIIDENSNYEFYKEEVTVGATYQGAMDSSIILSAEHIMSIDPNVHYDDVTILNNNKIGTDEYAQSEKLISKIATSSKFVSLKNYELQRTLYEKEVVNSQIIVGSSLFLFLIFIIPTIVLSTQIKIKNNIKNYMILRAIGANSKVISKLITNEVKNHIIISSVVGFVLGFLVVLFWANVMFPVGNFIIDIYIVMIAVSLIVFNILLLSTMHFVKKIIKKALTSNISQEINNIDF